MNIFRMVLAVVFPPAAVWDKGCGTVALVGILTLLFWIPGAIAAMYFVVRDMQRIPPPTEERSRDVFGAAQNFKSQPLGAPTPFDSAPPFNARAATPADPFAKTQSPATHQVAPSPDLFDEPKPPSRPKPPWES